MGRVTGLAGGWFNLGFTDDDDGPWVVWLQWRDVKVGEDQAQWGEALLRFLGGLPCGVEGIL